MITRLTLGLICAAAFPLAGQSREWLYPAVRNIDSVRVSISLEGESSKQFDSLAFRNLTELEFRRSGITVSEKAGFGPRSAIVYVDVFALGLFKNPQEGTEYTGNVLVARAARISGQAEDHLVQTWEGRRVLGAAGSALEAETRIRGALTAIVQQLVNDILAARGK